MQHPERGTILCYLIMGEDTWVLDGSSNKTRNEVQEYNKALFSHDETFDLEPEIQEWCNEAIAHHNA